MEVDFRRPATGMSRVDGLPLDSVRSLSSSGRVLLYFLKSSNVERLRNLWSHQSPAKGRAWHRKLYGVNSNGKERKESDMTDNKQLDALRKHSRESNMFVKDCLKTAMTQLAKEKNYNDISITELCKRAGVSRMAFYRNYQVTNDVIFEIARDLNSVVIEQVGSPFRNTVTRDWYIRVFEIIAEHREEMVLMFQENFQYQWMKIVNGFAVHDPCFSTEKQYQRIMWSGGFENAVSYWLNNGMKEQPEKMADYCIQYLPHLLQES